MNSTPELIVPQALDPLIAGTIFAGQISHVFETPSTNALAMEAAAKGAPEGSVFLAERQTSGRGRGGHAWHSPASLGIYCSAVLRPERRFVGEQDTRLQTTRPMPAAEALVLSLCAGLAAQTAVERVVGRRPDLRWPNDLLLNGRKLGGILVELNADAARVRFAVVGIGLNVNHESFPSDLEDTATSLRRETGLDWSRLELMAALLESLDREYCLFCTEPRDLILRRFEDRSSYARGMRVHVEENGGFEGVTEGLDERGFLRVRTHDGVKIVLSGGVRKL